MGGEGFLNFGWRNLEGREGNFGCGGKRGTLRGGRGGTLGEGGVRGKRNFGEEDLGKLWREGSIGEEGGNFGESTFG